MEIEQENKLSLKFKIPKIDSSAVEQEAGGSSSSSPDSMILSKRVCPECKKEFGTSKALSGHMRVHSQAFKKQQQRLHEVIGTRNQPIFKNHRNRSRSYSENSMSDGPAPCTVCRKVFRSYSSLFGHMRCHPERPWRGIKPPGDQLNSSSLSEDRGDDDDDDEGDTVFDRAQVVPRWSVKARRGKRSSVKNELSELEGSYEDTDEDETDEDEEMRVRNTINHLVCLRKRMNGLDSSGLRTLAAAAVAAQEIDRVDQHHQEITNGNAYKKEEFDDVRSGDKGFELVGMERRGSLGNVDDYPVVGNMGIEVGGSSTGHEMRGYIGSAGQEGNAAENHDVEDGFDGMNTNLVLGNTGIGGHRLFDGIINEDNHGEMVMGSKNNKGKKMKRVMESNQDQKLVPAVGGSGSARAAAVGGSGSAQAAAVGGSGSAQAAAVIASEKYKCTSCKKSFSSHQALGGHRSSHNKFKMMVINGSDSATDKHPPHRPSSVSTFVPPDEFNQSLVNKNDEFNQSQQQLNKSAECAVRHSIDEVGGGSKGDHISPIVYQCGVCSKMFPSGQALGGHKRCHWTAPADGQTEAEAQPQPQAQLAMRSSGEEASTQAGGKRIRLMGFDLNVPASMVVDAEGLGAAGW